MQLRGQSAALKLPRQMPDELSGGTAEFGRRYLAAQSYHSFVQFRLLMNPGLVRGWWWELAAEELENFYYDIIDGKRPHLLIGAPPQHGKSEMISDFMAWCAGRHPEWQMLFSSYADNLCQRANGKLQRYFLDPRYQMVFPRLMVKGSVPEGLELLNAEELKRNDDVIMFAQYRDDKGEQVGGGYFRNPTVNGQSTGFGYMLGVIDDPIKGRKEANSPTIRASTWDWLTDNFLSRKHDQAGLLIIMTRWHTDDPGARFIERYPDTRQFTFPAVAIKDEYVRRGQDNQRILLRRQGEALFPQWKTLEFLNIQKKGYSTSSWEAIYQQSPIIVGGGEFPIENFGPIDGFNRAEIRKSVRYWDKAGTEDGGKYTAGVLMHLLKDGQFIIEHGTEGQWGSLKRERIIKQTAVTDGKRVRIYVEQEPGSGGKESAESTVRNLRGFRAYADKVTDSKGVRAEPYAAQVQNNNVKIIRPKGESENWVRSFLDQHEVWPNGPLMDWVDAAAGAFNKLSESSYDASLSWIDDD